MGLDTILTDAAYQVERAKPADDRLKTQDWTAPGEAWFEAYCAAVALALEAAIKDEGTECPVCGISP